MSERIKPWKNRASRCQIVSGAIVPPGGIVRETAHWIVAHHMSPCPLRGWFVITATRHLEQIGDLLPDEAAELGVVVRNVSAALLDSLHPERIHVFSHGENVHHIHVHVFPRYTGMPESGAEALLSVRGGAWACSDEEASAAARELREHLS